MPAGRPKVGLDTLPKKWYEHVLKEYSEGASDEEIKAWIWKERGSFSNDLWERWMLEEPQFSETIKKGRQLSKAWWHRKGRKSLENKDFSPTLWYMNMKNRFGWMDKRPEEKEKEVYQPPIININIDNDGLATNEPEPGEDTK